MNANGHPRSHEAVSTRTWDLQPPRTTCSHWWDATPPPVVLDPGLRRHEPDGFLPPSAVDALTFGRTLLAPESGCGSHYGSRKVVRSDNQIMSTLPGQVVVQVVHPLSLYSGRGLVRGSSHLWISA